MEGNISKIKFRNRCWQDKIFIGISFIILSCILVMVAYPLLYVIFASFSAGQQNMTLWLIPRKFSLTGYEAVFKYKDIWTGYGNSIVYTLMRTLLSLTITMLCAYPLSRNDFKGRNFFMVICMITMYFSGGLIPKYLTIKELGLLNTRLVLILSGCFSVYNMIVARTYIKTSIPGEIWESARVDGCGNWRYLFSMVVPLSKPILAVIGLFCAVGTWNSYFDAMIYVSSRRELYPLALVLREVLVLDSTALEMMDVATALAMQERQQVMKYAVIVVSTVPVMLLYPFVQKYFVKGMMVGSVKG